MSGSTRSYRESDLKMLWGLAAARCGHPDCRVVCVEAKTTDDKASPRVGKIAHIVASTAVGPRGDAAFPSEELDRYDNLILLCANHHDIVDAQPASYSIELLRSWKSNHEKWVHDELQQSMTRVNFAELNLVCQLIMAEPAPPETDLRQTDPATKMSKNGLTSKLRGLIDMGLARFDVVSNYIAQSVEIVDYDFPERLKAGFLSEYYKKYHEGERGDALFESLREFASDGNTSFERSAAGLAVFCYLFQTCEVFEK